jgi:hypothetical protein
MVSISVGVAELNSSQHTLTLVDMYCSITDEPHIGDSDESGN